MASERLPARVSPFSQLWFKWTGKYSETGTSNIQTVVSHRPVSIGMVFEDNIKFAKRTDTPLKIQP